MSHDEVQVVAAAYRAARVAGQSDEEVFRVALEAYLARHPENPSDKAANEVSELVMEAAVREGDWLSGREG